jgi:hypothetical protein
MRPLGDASLRKPVHERCALTLWERLTFWCDWLGRTVEAEKPAIHYTNILRLASHVQYLDGGSRVGNHRSGTRRPRIHRPGDLSTKARVLQGTTHPRLFFLRHIGRGTHRHYSNWVARGDAYRFFKMQVHHARWLQPPRDTRKADNIRQA